MTDRKTPEEVMQMITKIKEDFTSDELSRIYDTMIGEYIINKGYEEQIDLVEVCLLGQIHHTKDIKLKEKYGDDLNKYYDDIINVLLPIVKRIHTNLVESSEALFNRVFQSNRPDDLPSEYK